jgi:hypothetical protein
MFLDPWHEGVTKAVQDNGDPNVINQARFDHATTTKWMRLFAQEGVKRLRAQGVQPQIITTLYGPPAWATEQKFMRGRDIDMREKYELAEYMIAWVKFLREQEKLPVRYLSLHNEGEDWRRWPVDASNGGESRHDYNAHWHSSIVADFLSFLRPMLDKQGLQDVGVTPGETTSWDRFSMWGYAYAIARNPEALKGLGLITSHGFGGPQQNIGAGTDLLRVKRPELHAWTTSMTWGKMDVSFVELIRQQIYSANVNGVIPWAAVQTLTWYGGDPNPGTAFRVENGGFSILPGYYYYKQVSRAGQAGMAVAEVTSTDPDVRLMAFASNGTKYPDAFIVLNAGASEKKLPAEVRGTSARAFSAFVTAPGKDYQDAGRLEVRDGTVELTIPAGGVITLFAQN